ncbi:Protein of unknown function [Gryllus bimaculatus]|nr:Protein of unknown function [Gryllus bimaculatus]
MVITCKYSAAITRPPGVMNSQELLNSSKGLHFEYEFTMGAVSFWDIFDEEFVRLHTRITAFDFHLDMPFIYFHSDIRKRNGKIKLIHKFSNLKKPMKYFPVEEYALINLAM